MARPWTPRLELRERAGRCRLSLGTWAVGEGLTLQEAADDLVANLLDAAARGRPELAFAEYVAQLSEVAAQGGDVRAYVLGHEELVRD
jgi:hypothetical protein